MRLGFVYFIKPSRKLDLKSRLIAGYVYNPPQTPPFEKEGLVVSLSAYLTCGERYLIIKSSCHSSLRRTINSAQIEKLRDRRSSLQNGGYLFVDLEQSCLRRRDKRDLRDAADIGAGGYVVQNFALSLFLFNFVLVYGVID